MSAKFTAKILIAFAFSELCAAGTAPTRIAVMGTAQDGVGSRLVFAIKEGIRRSSGMQLVDRTQDGLIRVNVVTLDPDDGGTAGRRTIYSVVWTSQTFHEVPVTMYLTNRVGICGTNSVVQCADRLVAETDEQASTVQGWIQGAADKKKK